MHGPLVDAAATYVRIRALAMPLQLVAMVCNAASIGVRDSASPLRITAAAAALNCAGDLVLCQVCHAHPRLGALPGVPRPTRAPCPLPSPRPNSESSRRRSTCCVLNTSQKVVSAHESRGYENLVLVSVPGLQCRVRV